jgi:site-specific DNA-methyltransferase (adenine-specific)
LIGETKRLTGITDHALSRKLGVAVTELRAVEAGTAVLSPAALQSLAAFHGAACAEKESRLPRVTAPEVEAGVRCGDALALLSRVPDASIDAIVSDIPYGIAHDHWDVLHPNQNAALLGQSAAQLRAGKVFDKRRKPINGWSSADRQIPQQYYAFCRSFAPEWLRVLKPGGSALIFAGRRFAHRCVQAMEDEGFNFRDMLAWLRPRAVFRAQRLSTVLQKRGQLAEAERFRGLRVGNLAPVFEPILWCFKPYDVTLVDNVLDHLVGAMDAEAFRARTGSYDNVIRAGFAQGEGGLHEAQKPVGLLETLIALCTPEGGIVLDPFAGSGSTGVAALRLGRRALLFERDAGYAEVAARRLLAAQP